MFNVGAVVGGDVELENEVKEVALPQCNFRLEGGIAEGTC